MVRHGHILNEVYRRSQIKTWQGWAASHTSIPGPCYNTLPPKRGIIVSIQSFFPVGIVKMIGTFQILIGPCHSLVQIIDVVAEKAVSVNIFIILEYLQCLNIYIFVNHALSFITAFLKGFRAKRRYLNAFP